MVGEHHKIDNRFNSDILSFTFIPMVNSSYKDKESLIDFSSLLPVKISPMRFNSKVLDETNISEIVLKGKYERIFIGMDLDIMGNAMSRILYDYLVKIGFKKENIIRVPLTSSGFRFISDFWDNDLMNWFVSYSKEEMEYIQFSKKTLGNFGVGRRRPLILNELLNPPIEIDNLNSDGTSSITYMIKKKIREF